MQPEKYLKYSNKFGYAGHMLPMTYVTYTYLLQGDSSHIDIYRDNSINDNSYTYNILSHLFISGD